MHQMINKVLGAIQATPQDVHRVRFWSPTYLNAAVGGFPLFVCMERDGEIREKKQRSKVHYVLLARTSI